MKPNQSAYGKVSLQIPNKLAKIYFLDRLVQVLSLSEKLLYDFQRNPKKCANSVFVADQHH